MSSPSRDGRWAEGTGRRLGSAAVARRKTAAPEGGRHHYQNYSPDYFTRTAFAASAPPSRPEVKVHATPAPNPT